LDEPAASDRGVGGRIGVGQPDRQREGYAVSFIQIVEYETDRADEIAAAMSEQSMPSPEEVPGFRRMAFAQDRDNPKRYFVIVEFDSYEQAMANSDKPETDAMAKQLGAMVTKGPTYYNLDVQQTQP
jgi:heme-degrading monooxygenase HmoA